jgi:chitodextrinase
MKASAVLAVLAVLAVAAPTAAAAGRDRTPPSTPTGLRVVSVTEDSLTLSWNRSTDNSGSIHAYIVNGLWHPGTSTTKTMTGLVPNFTQAYRVQAIDAAGNYSAPSAPLTATTAPDVTPPTTPANLRVTGTTLSTVSLAWDRSTDRWSFGYDVLMDGQVTASASNASTTVRNVAPGSTHVWTVRARDYSGNISPSSNAGTVTQPASADTTPPSPPSNLTAVSLDDFCGSQILNWGQSTDDTDPQSAIEYEIFLNGRFFTLNPPGSSAFLYTVSGTNTWTVVAVDRSGNHSAPSNPATVTVVADEMLC